MTYPEWYLDHLMLHFKWNALCVMQTILADQARSERQNRQMQRQTEEYAHLIRQMKAQTRGEV